MKNRFYVFFLFFMLGLLVYFNSLNNKFLIDDYAFLSNPVMSQTKYIFSSMEPLPGAGIRSSGQQGIVLSSLDPHGL